MKSITTYIIESNKLSNIPIDCGIDEPKYYENDIMFSTYKYFGNCKNTSKIWDATQMAGFVNSCKVIKDIDNILDNIQNGDKSIPKQFTNAIDKIKGQNKLNDLSEIVFAINDYQRILFIYISELDIHFFFDCKR